MTQNIVDLLHNIQTALRGSLEAQARSASRRAVVETLEAKSDVELARMGLKRENIGQHVFRDLFYA